MTRGTLSGVIGERCAKGMKRQENGSQKETRSWIGGGKGDTCQELMVARTTRNDLVCGVGPKSRNVSKM
jgi:hypothetical protein